MPAKLEDLLSIRRQSAKLANGQHMEYVEMPDAAYDALRPAVRSAGHLEEIDKLDRLGDAQGVVVLCRRLADGLQAAAILVRKWERDIAGKRSRDSALVQAEDEEAPDESAGWEEEGASFGPDEEDGESMDEDDDANGDDPARVTDSEGRMIRLPIVTYREFGMALGGQEDNFPIGIGQMNMLRGDTSNPPQEPYWLDHSYPLVLVAPSHGYYSLSANTVKRANRFILYVIQTMQKSWLSEPEDSSVAPPFAKQLVFECDFDLCPIGQPAPEYYAAVLRNCVEREGYRLSRKADAVKLVEELREFRREQFDSYVDIERFVKLTIRREASSSRLAADDFRRALLMHRKVKMEAPKESGKAETQLDRMIGLGEVKAQLRRLVKRLKLERERMRAGLSAKPAPMAAVFMGSPGTAKTTVARLFGRWLAEERVLDNGEFHEVSRKDLIGKYVGWTAHVVQEAFEEARGGILFIDEAYSLLGNGGADFADEAMAEIVLQMENNPGTLVIFAGYPDEMRRFIAESNSGLRSRLTNLIEFPDYSDEEMFDILRHMASQEQYKLEREPEARELVLRFLVGQRLDRRGANQGNGRLMRKLLKAAIGHMAEREAQDMTLLALDDLRLAIEELERADRLAARSGSMRIGYLGGSGK
ncbi:AAA family ATPase [Cohnella caldifontis]|uniref:AAA family ATPase n=1 Tax=Cohnella caldifontis TaxID=3027471 RepID=UPI0023EAC406|nr:AAA family ATPase [Cohnella sp. YIM B05605]